MAFEATAENPQSMAACKIFNHLLVANRIQR